MQIPDKRETGISESLSPPDAALDTRTRVPRHHPVLGAAAVGITKDYDRTLK